MAAGAIVAVLVGGAPPGTAATQPPPPPSPTAPCDALSPIAIPCTLLGKTADAVAAECRRAGVPDERCTVPLAHKVTQAARDAYLKSWVHQAAEFQYALGGSLPLRDAQWIGTHNSFNSPSDSLTLSHEDSNQQLTLTQQLDIDVRALELDLHWIPRLERLGQRAVTVCHGESPSEADLGCTNEPLFSTVLPKIADWLDGHSDQVILLYLEDQMQKPAAYASTIATLDTVLRRPDGSSMIYRPDPSKRAANGCTPLPLGVSRDQVRASGAQVILVGSCAPGWSADVFDWNADHVESGSTSAYQPYPACDATYDASVYATKLVRYFEDSTLVANLLDPTRPPADPNALTPAKVQSMTDCGVNLFGFDQLLPEDGRIQATVWSWAPDEPRVDGGGCTLQRADGRWVAAPCADRHPAACRSGSTWTVTAPVPYAAAAAACASSGSTFALPRSGDQNAALQAVAGTSGGASPGAGGAWLRYRITS
ncbi:hypothetical protein [Nocardioides terrisoli]|uniref:hypothetical protein n=1 Tax=Nocardioides terrisoli TaxID=3388267 RepID=UPI00287B8B84|nr:hypothetical protein [Nocardioides marmorisolisilvae]